MPNIFELLELDPNLPWEPQGRTQYEARLRTQRAKWANLRNAPGKQGADATRYFTMVVNDDFGAVMRDAAAREAQRRERLQTLADKRNKLEATLAAWQKEEPIVTSRQIKNWSRSFEVDEATVERRVKEIGLLVVAEASPGNVQRLNPVTEKKVRETLQSLKDLDPAHADRYVNLYTLLEKTPIENMPDDPSDLSAVAQALNATLQRNSNKDDILTKKIELAGDAMTIFKTTTSRAQYDEALRLNPLECLLDEMEIATGGAAPRAGHIDAYFHDARKVGFDDDDIRRELGFRAQRSKWGVIEIPRRPAEGLCPFCTELVVLDSNSCPACGKLLKLTCPNCGKGDIAVDRPSCPACGFLTGQRGWVLELVNEARSAITKARVDRALMLIEEASGLWSPAKPDALMRSFAEVRDQIHHLQRQRLAEEVQSQLNAANNAIIQAEYTTARSLIDEARTRWMPDHPETDALVARMKALDGKLAPFEDEIEELRRKAAEQERLRQEGVAQIVMGVEASLGDHNLITAQKRLQSLSLAERQRPDVANLAHAIQVGLDKADEQVRRAKSADSVEECVRLCYAALNICADHPAAMELLKASRPPSPGQVNLLQVTRSGGQATVEVTWGASAEERVTYAVRRKVGAVPASEQDGDLVPCDSTARRAVDQRPPSGVELYYAVFAIRPGVDAYSAPTSTPEPVVLATEVRRARAEAQDGAVSLTWEAPEPVQQIVIVRKEGAPPRSHLDGASVRVLGAGVAGSAVDKGLVNGTVYYYGVYCQYARGVTSHGVVVQAIPHARPNTPPPLRISGRLNSVGWCEVELQWGKATNAADESVGRKVAYRIDPTPLFRSGAELSEHEAQPYIWAAVEMRHGRGEDRLSQPGIALYAPALIVGGAIYTGAPQPFRFIPDLEQVETHSVVGAIHVTWRWPLHVTDVIITTGTAVEEVYASVEALKGTGALLVSRQAGDDDQAHYDVPAQARRRLRLTIAPVIRSAGRLITGAPVALQGEAAEMAEISYEFSKPLGGPFARSASYTLLLRIHNHGPLTTLPPLVALFTEGHEPHDKSDGEEWWMYAEQPLPRGELRLSLPALPQRSGNDVRYGAVFFADDAQTRFARLVSAGANKTRLR